MVIIPIMIPRNCDCNEQAVPYGSTNTKTVGVASILFFVAMLLILVHAVGFKAYSTIIPYTEYTPAVAQLSPTLMERASKVKLTSLEVRPWRFNATYAYPTGVAAGRYVDFKFSAPGYEEGRFRLVISGTTVKIFVSTPPKTEKQKNALNTAISITLHRAVDELEKQALAKSLKK